METSDVVRLLENFVIDNPQLNELENLVAEFNIFEAMGSVRQELRHSDFLAFLLNPSEKHGLDDRFLKRFLMRVLSIANDPPVTPIRINVIDLSGATVERESQGIDILIHDAESGIVCVIENKVFTDEHSNQLARYYQGAQRRYPNATAIIPVFLTPDGISPQDEDSPYIPFSYGEVADIIDHIREAQASMLGADVHTMMRHYVTMLRRHIVSDSDIAQLCQQIYQRHRAALDLIFEHKPDLRKDLADYLASLVRNQPSVALFREVKLYVNFLPLKWLEVPEFDVGIGWPGSSATLSLEFGNGQNELSLRLVLGPVEDENQYIREAIFDCADTNRDIFAGCQHKLAYKYVHLYRVSLLRRKDYDDASLEDLAQLVEPRWQHFLQDVLPHLEEQLLQIQF